MNVMIKNLSVVLASGSPRRRELLHRIFNEFDVIPSDVEEVVPEGLAPCDQAQYLASLKAASLAERFPERLIIGSDTVVIVDGQVMGKPADEEDAKRMLRSLSGRKHTVATGCALFLNGRQLAFVEETEVEFYPMSEQEIEDYVKSGDPMDKAGAYGIQSGAALFVKGIQGDYSTVMGLPVARLYQELKAFLEIE